MKQKKSQQKTSERTDWLRNHELVMATYLRLYQSRKKLPTQEQVALACGLSRDTVMKHLRSVKLADVIPAVQSETAAVLRALTKTAKAGKAQEVKLWMQLVHNFEERVKHSGYVGQVDLKDLTKEQLRRISSGEDIANVLANQNG